MRKAFLIGLAAIVMALGAPSPAFASCALRPSFPASLQGAQVVFVGTVTSASNGGRKATVQVEAIWYGPDLPAQVEVIGSPALNGATSIDRSFQPGVRYLFVPTNNQPPFQDNACSATQPYSPEMAAYAPDGARQVHSAAATQPWASYWLLLLVVPITALGIVLALSAWRRQKTS
jgi:hypothetical protein